MITSKERTQFERDLAASHNRDFVPAVVGYVATTVALVVLVDFETAGWWKYLAALVPLLPALWGLRAVARHVRRVDEMQRQAMLGAMALGFGLAMIVAMTIGFLSMTGLDTSRWGPWVIYVAGMIGWAAASIRSGAHANE